jgi:arylsulfatase A-like enzyme
VPLDSRLPNLLIVFADQLRAGMTGAEGNTQAITPHIDRLAADGVLVEPCIANTPVCCPSRATMWTGTHAPTHRVLSNDLPVRCDLPTLATVARDAGYRCGYVGKWHLDGVPRCRFTPPGPRRLGFDHFWAAYNCTHSYFDAKYFRDQPSLQRDDRYEPTVQTDLAVEFLDDATGDERPFCLALSWGPPHDPYPQVPDRFRAMFDPQALRRRANVIEPLDNPLARDLDFARTQADYYAAVAALDHQLGRLMAALEARGLARDTIVVFTSDHGDMLWSHGWMKKQSPYEESIRVPLILRGPGLPGGRRCETLMGLVDLMPTLLGLLGLPVPPGVEGHDRSAVLRGRRDAHVDDDAQLISNPHSCDEAEMQQMPEWRGVRTLRHTYVERVGREPWLLFDNFADPYQQRNLVHDPGAAELRTALAAKLEWLLTASGDPFLPGEQLLAHFGLARAWEHRVRHVNDSEEVECTDL